MCIHGGTPTDCKKCNNPYKSVLRDKKTSMTKLLDFYSFPEEIQKGEIRMIAPETKASTWKVIRLKIIKRDKTCRICFVKKDLVVHHIDCSGDGSNHIYSNNAPKNLITLCRSCHAKIHQEAYKRLGKQYVDLSDSVYSKSARGYSQDGKAELR